MALEYLPTPTVTDGRFKHFQLEKYQIFYGIEKHQIFHRIEINTNEIVPSELSRNRDFL